VDIPEKLFEVLNEQREGLVALQEKCGHIVTPAELEAL